MSHPRVALAADHAGFALKHRLLAWLAEHGYQPVDLGTGDEDSVDYPDYADAVARAVVDGAADRGVLMCGSGIGMSIAANRHKGIRAALVGDVEAARLARQHNDANVLVLGGRRIRPEDAVACLEAFLETAFDGGRHQRRVDKLG